MKFSLAIITLNEQHNILPLLNNVYDIFDQIVFVDGCSTDKTMKVIDDFVKDVDQNEKIEIRIQPQNGPRYSKSWDQSAQRNLALQQCTGDWIFTMDADERLDGDTRKNLEELVLYKPNCIAWAMPTRHYWDKPTQIRSDKRWWPNYHYRFWQNNLGIRYSPHSRHCFPMIPQYPDVRKQLKVVDVPPYSGVIIHHYHHCPIKRSGEIYRANFIDVRTIEDLERGAEIREVEPRRRSEREDVCQNEH